MNGVLPGMPSENHPLQQPWHRLSNTVSICQFAEAGTESKPLGVTRPGWYINVAQQWH